ncbi:nucleotidyltransferase domain-containing protein [Pedobacter sp. MC2016-15]|uniref:nucleotidyltransferase family protein n=1 Tax=Pedobacter sp. MC2016-15 TaxID=2994473 RepID=UPI002247AC14|nr:nucleotidyltransferase domain-containing protein [Pedobacter sp. MC2016-15]MCX2480561.1 nucleotidyltransferase domain-containing protein [Pedobacter sp. MC2016-15]
MKLLEKYQTEIDKMCRLYNVNQLFAFGSVLTDNFNDSSDVDLIVNFNIIKIEDYVSNYYNFKYSLESILQRPVDLLESKALKNPYFIKSVDNQKQLIYG